MLIGSLVELAWGEIDSEPIIAKIASEEIKSSLSPLPKGDIRLILTNRAVCSGM